MSINTSKLFRKASRSSSNVKVQVLPQEVPFPLNFNNDCITSATLISRPFSSNSNQTQNYADARAEYKRAVSKIRREYAMEIQRQTKMDEESKQKQRELVTRQRLERQRHKNIRSTQNAMRQEQLRVEQKQRFEQHLQQQQLKRQQRSERFQDARRIVLQELDQQSKYWMVTPQDVDELLCKTKNPFIDQQLWTRPGSFVGEPAPSSDANFWRYESHTWKIQSTYPTAKEKLLENIHDIVYDQSNVDDKVYWNKDRIEYQDDLERKAKLRALVQNEGKRLLLLKQRQLMQDLHSQQLHANQQDSIVPPKLDVPVPSSEILANYEAMEQEGVKVLRKHPDKFFHFANKNIQTENDSKIHVASDGENTKTTTDLGKPIGLVDPVRDSSFTNTPYPELIGRLPKPDLRTEKEKKRQEREEKMLAAALKKDSSNDAQSQMEADIENELSFGLGIQEENVDYEQLANLGDEEDLEWEEGLDPILDKDILDVPFDQRYTEDDIDWIISKLEAKVESLKEILMLEEGSDAVLKGLNLGQDNNSFITSETSNEGIINNSESKPIDMNGQENISHELDDFNDIISVLTANDLNDLIHVEDKQNVLKTLSDEQLSALQSLNDNSGVSQSSKSAEQIREALTQVPGLEESQIQSLVELELSLATNNDVQKLLHKQK